MAFRLIAVVSAAVAAALVVSLAFAAPAHADQDGFLNMLGAGGAFDPAANDAAEADRELLGLGYAICDEMYTDGWSEQRAVSDIMRVMAKKNIDASPQRAQLLVTAAHSQLCPDAG